METIKQWTAKEVGGVWKKRELKTTREYIKIYGPAVFLTIVGFIAAYQFVNPAPPDHIVIGTG